MDSNFNNDNEPWELSLDIDNFDLHLTPVMRPSSSTRFEPTPSTSNTVRIIPNHVGTVQQATPNAYCPNPVRIIPGLVGIVQQAKLLKEKIFILDSDGDLVSTQEYMQKVVEDVVEDNDFNGGAWVSATNYMIANGGSVTGYLSGTIPGTVHHKVIGEGGYGKDITVRAALILANVLVFSPKPSMHYLNITMRNVIKVFYKDTIHGSSSVILDLHAHTFLVEYIRVAKVLIVGYEHVVMNCGSAGN
nr:hypothetical protein [Tanacetum cinerariifolium]